MQNVIEDIRIYTLTESYDSVLYVPLTLYSPAGFAPRHMLNLDTFELVDIDYGGDGFPSYNGETYDPNTDQFEDWPIILSDESGEHAIAIYSPDAINRYSGPWYGSWDYGVRSIGYGRWYMGAGWGAKIALFFRAGETPISTNVFRQFVVFGTLQNVKDTIGYLAETEGPLINRGSAAHLINLAFDTNYTPSAQSFLDVPTDHEYYADIEHFAADSITGGCAYQLFCPDQALVRRAAVTYLLKRMGESAASCTTPIYDDVPDEAPLCGWINRAYEIGLDTGCGNGNFCPVDPVTVDDLRNLIEAAL
jgi:hypothetical protein